MSIQSLKRFLAGATRLDVRQCLKRNAALGLFAGGVPILVLLVPTRGTPQVPVWAMVLQISIGLTFAAASAVAWRRPELSGRVFVAQGIVLAIAVGAYVSFMIGILSSRHLGRVAHAPGILALGLAYALRLIVDFAGIDESRRARLAPRLAIVGLVVGGCGDLVLLRMMFQQFHGAG